MKYLPGLSILCLLAASFNTVQAQLDSTRLDSAIRGMQYIAPTVTISQDSLRFRYVWDGISIEGARYSENRNGSLADILERSPGLYVKKYATGVASPAIRGTAANHTKLYWGNMSLNSPMLGSSDLNLFPAFLLKDVDIMEGGASLAYGSGGLGGIAKVYLTPIDTTRMLSFMSGYGSFGQLRTAVNSSYKLGRLKAASSLYRSSARNDFIFRNTARFNTPLETLQNAASLQYGALQSFFLKQNRGGLSADVWYQKTQRELPGLMTSAPLGESQDDESLRIVAGGYRSLKNARSKYESMRIDLGYSREFLGYTHPLADIYSRSHFHKMRLDAGYYNKVHLEEKAPKWFHYPLYYEIKILSQYDQARTDAYGQWRKQWLNGLSQSLQFSLREIFGLTLTARQQILDNKLQPFAFNALGRIYTSSRGNTYFFLSAGRNYNYPTLNDLYWVPGGNPALKAETAWQHEAGFQAKTQFIRLYHFYFKISGFYNAIDNYIQWQPANASYWEARNLGKVLARGAQAELTFSRKLGNDWKLGALVNYTFTRSTDARSARPERQLLYVPVHMGNAALRAYWRKYYATAEYQYTGSRNTVDNALPAYGLVNILAGRSFTSKRLSGSLQLKLNNLLNEEYQVIAWRAMPGRNFMIDLKLDILR